MLCDILLLPSRALSGELTAHSRWCSPEFILDKSQRQAWLPHTRTSQEYHLNPEGPHWSTWSVTMELSSSWNPWEQVPHEKWDNTDKQGGKNPVVSFSLDAVVLILWAATSNCMEELVRLFCCESPGQCHLVLHRVKVKPKSKVWTCQTQTTWFHFLVYAHSWARRPSKLAGVRLLE